MDAKDLIIEKQAAEIKMLKEAIKRLEEKIAQLEKNSNNSSKPPSSDIVKPKKTVIKVGQRKRKRGGQSFLSGLVFHEIFSFDRVMEKTSLEGH
jgi:hypothetical protein